MAAAKAREHRQHQYTNTSDFKWFFHTFVIYRLPSKLNLVSLLTKTLAQFLSVQTTGSLAKASLVFLCFLPTASLTYRKPSFTMEHYLLRHFHGKFLSCQTDDPRVAYSWVTAIGLMVSRKKWITFYIRNTLFSYLWIAPLSAFKQMSVSSLSTQQKKEANDEIHGLMFDFTEHPNLTADNTRSAVLHQTYLIILSPREDMLNFVKSSFIWFQTF